MNTQDFSACETLICRGCNTPLAQKTPEGLRILTRNQGKISYTDVIIRHSGSGVIQVECERCRGRVTGHIFVTLRMGSKEKAVVSIVK